MDHIRPYTYKVETTDISTHQQVKPPRAYGCAISKDRKPKGTLKAKESEAKPCYLESLLFNMLSPVVRNKQMVFNEIQQSSLAPGVWKLLGVYVSWYKIRQPPIWFAGMDTCKLQTHLSLFFFILKCKSQMNLLAPPICSDFRRVLLISSCTVAECLTQAELNQSLPILEKLCLWQHIR